MDQHGLPQLFHQYILLYQVQQTVDLCVMHDIYGVLERVQRVHHERISQIHDKRVVFLHQHDIEFHEVQQLHK